MTPDDSSGGLVCQLLEGEPKVNSPNLEENELLRSLDSEAEAAYEDE